MNKTPAFKNVIAEAIKDINYKRFLIQIQFTSDIEFSYYHGAKLYDFLCKSLRRNRTRLGEDIILSAPESGNISYKKGDFYNFGITKFGIEDTFKDDLIKGIEEISNFNQRVNGLEGRYKLVFVKELPQINIPDFKEHNDDIYSLRFTSPFRMERESPIPGHKFFDNEYFDVNRFVKLLFLRFKRIVEKFGSGQMQIEIPLIESSMINFCFHWVDMPYPQKTLGGIIGKLHFFSKLNDELKYILWFGQIMNSGSNVSFGLGNYEIENNHFRILKFEPYSDLIEKILAYDNLYSAYLHIKSNIEKSEASTFELEKFENNLNTNLISIVNDVRNRIYEPQILRGVKIRKPNGEYRYLAIPEIKDRIFQRATAQILSPSIDRLLEESSFAYRKGFSRQSAAKSIMHYNDAGYKYVIKTDIESFFDSVNWKLLFDKIEALINNSYLNEILVHWISAPVHYNNIKISRTLGLPQGSSISPVLANLYLDEFDELLQDNYKLIRYCDDFVILLKDIKNIEEAKKDVNDILKKFFLELDLEKTKITTFAEGFNYLGFLFTETEIFESSKKGNILLGTKPFNDFEKDWLNTINTKNIKELPSEEVENYLIQSDSTGSIKNKAPVYLSGFNTRVTLNNDCLYFTDNTKDRRETKIPLSKISSLCFIGTPNSSIQSIIKLSELNIPVFFCRSDGKVQMTVGLKNNFHIWNKQYKFSENNEVCLKIAKELVKAKINNSRVISLRNKWKKEISDKLQEYFEQIEHTKDINELLGIEGIASKKFFEGMKNSIPNEWNFVGRQKHPALDPVNAMLSFGYTIIYNHITSAIIMAGLNPEIGIYHKLKNGHNALASDLLEEFRFLIDSLILYFVHKKIFSKTDFENANGRIILIKECRKKFITYVEKRIRETYNFENGKMSYMEYFYKNAIFVKRLICGNEDEYKPFFTK